MLQRTVSHGHAVIQLAYFAASTTHARDVVEAALEIRDFIEASRTSKLARGLPCFEIRIGIHSGPVVAGIVGTRKFAYDIWGDTENIASRMESSGEVGQVNISEATFNRVKDETRDSGGKRVPAYRFHARGKVNAKGEGELFMYFVQRGD